MRVSGLVINPLALHYHSPRGTYGQVCWFPAMVNLLYVAAFCHAALALLLWFNRAHTAAARGKSPP